MLLNTLHFEDFKKQPRATNVSKDFSLIIFFPSRAHFMSSERKVSNFNYFMKSRNFFNRNLSRETEKNFFNRLSKNFHNFKIEIYGNVDDF